MEIRRYLWDSQLLHGILTLQLKEASQLYQRIQASRWSYSCHPSACVAWKQVGLRVYLFQKGWMYYYYNIFHSCHTECQLWTSGQLERILEIMMICPTILDTDWWLPTKRRLPKRSLSGGQLAELTRSFIPLFLCPPKNTDFFLFFFLIFCLSSGQIANKCKNWNYQPWTANQT